MGGRSETHTPGFPNVADHTCTRYAAPGSDCRAESRCISPFGSYNPYYSFLEIKRGAIVQEADHTRRFSYTSPVSGYDCLCGRNGQVAVSLAECSLECLRLPFQRQYSCRICVTRITRPSMTQSHSGTDRMENTILNIYLPLQPPAYPPPLPHKSLSPYWINDVFRVFASHTPPAGCGDISSDQT